jgi:hypothetical protein
MPQRHIMIVTSAAHPGREVEFNQWYDQHHLADVCAIPGVVSGRRFDAAPSSPMPTPAPYMSIFEIDAADPLTVLAEMNRRAQSGEWTMTTSLDPSAVKMWLYAHHR